MNKQEILERIANNAFEAQKRDDLCARSTMYGLKTFFGFIPEEMVTASMSLAGGTGGGSGSCGAYCSGLLAIGLKYNPTMAEESVNIELRKKGSEKFLAFRDSFLKEFGTIQCPEIHKIFFGRSYIFTDEEQHHEFFAIPEHAEKCGRVVAKAARLAAEAILED